jgi:ATP-dependent DNA helicase DinG
VAAERHTCTARHCPRYRDCSYYQARSRLAEAQVIVANHDLVLASVGMKTLPELDNCLLVFDEGHHLPAVALRQFSSAMDLSNLRWLDKLPRALREVSGKIQMVLAQDVDILAQQLKSALNDLARLLMDRLSAESTGYNSLHRLRHGALPLELQAPLALVQGHAAGLSAVLEELASELKRLVREDPSQALGGALMYARLGQLAPRLLAVAHTSSLLLTHSDPPLAKWFEADTSSGLVVVSAHACPIVPGDLLRQHLWRQVRAAVVTSATLTSCGSFDYFLQEAGLDGQAQVTTLAVASPFDYQTQGRLVVVETAADPRDAPAYTRAMVAELMKDLRQVSHGALALFTSRLQMRAAIDALDAPLLTCVLVQGQLSRSRLLAAHQARIEAGQASIIFGLQSFGEGLDLPGRLCETVFIAKLPFSPPADPVEEARAEWLKTLGRDPFAELVVPATGVRLLQWTGRAIRTEEDRATVVCYDRRLLQQGYGQRMLSGLPPYALSRRSAPTQA